MSTRDLRVKLVMDGDNAGLSAAVSQSEAELAKLDATGKKVEILTTAIQNAKDARAALVDARESAEILDKQLADARGAGAGKDAIKLLEQALKDANRELRDSEKAWVTSRERLDAARAAAAAAGVDTRNLATEQGRLKSELEAATAVVQRNTQAINDAQRAAQERLAADRAAAAEEQRLAAIVEAGIQRQKMAAQELLEAERRGAQEAQLAANKIAAGQREAAAAAEALNAAFRQLGVRPLQEVVAETNRLQAALAQVRASGITSAEQQQAIAAFQTKLAALRAEAHGVAPELASAGNAVQDFGNKSESMGGMVAGAARNVAALAGAAVGLQAFTGITRDVISTGAAFETLEGRLVSLLGSSDKAKDAFAQIKELARTTPFEVSGLTEAYVKLTAFGLQPSMKQMQAISDTAATLGGGTEALQRVTLALGQAWTKSKLQGDEILQLAEAGVPVWDLLAQATGKNVAELQKMSEAGTLGRTVILKLIDALGAENMGASAKLMATFTGAVSNAHDALDEFYSLIAQSGVLEYLTKQLQDLLAEFDRMKASGELQAEAKAIADGFVKMAEGAKSAVEAVTALSGVIKTAIELYIAWRVGGMALIPMLSGVGSAATGAATATKAMNAAAAAGAVESKALGAAATTAATGVGMLGNALRLIKGAALVGIITEVVSLGAEFFRAKAAAEEADRVLKEAMKPTPLNGPAKDFELVATNAVMTRIKTEEVAAAFYQAADAGKAAGEALKDALAGAKFESPQGITDILRGLDQIQGSARATGEEIRASLVDRLKSLTANELADFATMADFAFGRGKISAEQLAFAIDTHLDAALVKAGVSASTASDGMTAKFRESAGTVSLLTGQIETLRGKGVETDRVFIDLVTKTLPQAAGRREFEFLAQQVEQFGAKAGLAKNEVDRLMETIRKKSEEAKPGIQSMAEAFERLGLKSREALQQTEKSAKEAYDYIRNNGGSIKEQQAAWDRYAEAAKAANSGVLPPLLRAQDEMYKLGRAGQQAGQDIRAGMSSGVSGVQQVLSDAERLVLKLEGLRKGGITGSSSMNNPSSFEDLRRAGATPADLQAMGYTQREIEDYVNKNDQAQPGTVNRTVTTTSADNYRVGIENGLTAEQAKVFAEVFSDYVTRANVAARGAAAGTGGVGFGVDEYAGFQKAALREALDYARTHAAQTQATASAQQGAGGSNTSSGFWGASRTVTVNLNIGGRTTPVNVTDQSQADALVRALQQAQAAQS